ncbi:MAG: DUF2079 domain-containing protein, partial [Actinomycetota bacterium]
PLGARINAWVRGRTIPQVLVTLAILVYLWHYTVRSLDNHHALGTSTYDSALYDQGVWLLSRFEAPFVTLMGRNLFGDHTSFVLLFLVPIYWLFPSVGVLFFAQSAAIGAGAIPIFLYGRSRLGNEWFALVAAGAYLVHPAVGWTNLENFHPDAFLGVFVGFALYFALERRWRLYATFVVLSLLVKEDASLVLVPLGIWVALRRDRRAGLLTIFGSVAFMAVAMFVVMRSLIGVPTRNTWRLPFSQPGDSTIGAAFRVVRTGFTDPRALWDHLTSDDRPWYLWQMTAPFAWLFLRLPWVAMIGGLVLFTNILSTFWYQYQIEYHYSLVVVPAMAIGTIHAIGAIREWRDFRVPDAADEGARTLRVPMRGLAVATLAVVSWQTSTAWSPVPWGNSPQWYGDPDNRWATSMREVIEVVPDDAVVAAHYRVTPHMAHRTEIYQFPTPFRAVLYGPNGNVDGPRVPDRAERVEYVVLPISGDDYPVDDWVLIQEAFDVVEANEVWIVYRRVPDIALPPERAT